MDKIRCRINENGLTIDLNGLALTRRLTGGETDIWIADPTDNDLCNLRDVCEAELKRREVWKKSTSAEG